MPTAAQVLAVAAAEVGSVEHPTIRVEHNDWYYGRAVSGASYALRRVPLLGRHEGRSHRHHLRHAWTRVPRARFAGGEVGSSWVAGKLAVLASSAQQMLTQ